MAFPTGWGRKQSVTIDNTKVAGTGSHTDLPVLITLDHLDAEVVDAGSNSALNGGGDVRFSSDATGSTRLDLDVVSFVTNATEGNRECEMWVKVPSVSTSADTDIYIWYKKASETQPAVSAAFGRNVVWTEFDFVQHNSTLVDSTGNHTIVAVGTHWDITPTAFPSLSSGFTFQAWVKESDTDYFDAIEEPFVGFGTSGEFAKNYAMCIRQRLSSTRTPEHVTNDVESVPTGLSVNATTVGKNLWFSWSYTSAGVLTPIVSNEGTESVPGTTTFAIPSETWDRWAVGALADQSPGNEYAGTINEARAAKTNLSADFGLTCGRNILDPATFASAGTPEDVDGIAVFLLLMQQSFRQ